MYCQKHVRGYAEAFGLYLDLQTLVGPVQTALVPVVLASTGGLLCLVVQTRYGRIVDRIRELSRTSSSELATPNGHCSASSSVYPVSLHSHS